MRFSQLLLAAFAFSTVVYGQLANGQNSITYPLGGTLDSGTPVTIQWKPTTTGTVTIKLLKGPPANIIAIDVIAASIENSGSFTWTIPNSLQDSSSMPTGDKYGFKIIDDLTGTYEYSPPFDLSITNSTFGATSLASVSPTPTPTHSVTSESTSAISTSSLSAVITPNSTYPSTVTSVPTTNSTQLGSFPTTTQSTSATTTYSSTLAQSTNTGTQSNDTGSETKPGPKMSTIIGAVCGVAGGFILAVVALTVILKRKSQRKVRPSSVMLNRRSTSLRYNDPVYTRV